MTEFNFNQETITKILAGLRMESVSENYFILCEKVRGNALKLLTKYIFQ